MHLIHFLGDDGLVHALKIVVWVDDTRASLESLIRAYQYEYRADQLFAVRGASYEVAVASFSGGPPDCIRCAAYAHSRRGGT